MTIDEANIIKMKSEGLILEILENLENQTGLQVDSIELSGIELQSKGGTKKRILEEVSIKLQFA